MLMIMMMMNNTTTPALVFFVYGIREYRVGNSFDGRWHPGQSPYTYEHLQPKSCNCKLCTDYLVGAVVALMTAVHEVSDSIRRLDQMFVLSKNICFCVFFV